MIWKKGKISRHTCEDRFQGNIEALSDFVKRLLDKGEHQQAKGVWLRNNMAGRPFVKHLEARMALIQYKP